MEEIEEGYSIIPTKILNNKELKANAKLLYSMVLSLSFQKGYCYATNNYFAERLNANPKTISDWLSDLRDKNLIKCEYIKGENKQIIQRKIYIVDIPFPLNNGYLYPAKNGQAIHQNMKDNIINNNIKMNNKNNKNFSFYYDGQREYSDDFFESLYAN